MTALLDVNVLIAVAWPNHVGHATARSWFAARSADGWATTPVTESGFVRVSSNRRALATATTPHEAVTMLHRLTALPGHQFWPDAIRLVTGDQLDPASLTGHRQVTDAHLLALCMDRDGRLVTFDESVSALAPSAPERVELLKA